MSRRLKKTQGENSVSSISPAVLTLIEFPETKMRRCAETVLGLVLFALSIRKAMRYEAIYALIET